MDLRDKQASGMSLEEAHSVLKRALRKLPREFRLQKEKADRTRAGWDTYAIFRHGRGIVSIQLQYAPAQPRSYWIRVAVKAGGPMKTAFSIHHGDRDIRGFWTPEMVAFYLQDAVKSSSQQSEDYIRTLMQGEPEPIRFDYRGASLRSKIIRLAHTKPELRAHLLPLVADKIPGGLADKKKPGEFDSKQIQKGIKVEMEHTGDLDIAREIAMDHLTEDPKYYDKLETIESHG